MPLLLVTAAANGCRKSPTAQSEVQPLTDRKFAAVDGESASPGLLLTGRFETKNPRGPRFAWPGSTIAARFQGSSARVTLRDEPAGLDETGEPMRNVYQVWVDDTESVLWTDEDEKTYTLAEGLGPGEHSVVLYKRTEPMVGRGQFLGFDFGPDGELLSAPPSATRRIEFIGDSITAGYGNEGPNGNCPFSTATENNYLAYGAIAARQLKAEHITVAWSGRGVFRNLDGSTQGTMGQLYPATLPEYDHAEWDYNLWTPDVVVINLGSNDFMLGDPGEAPFIQAFRNLLSVVRNRYPSAHIFTALGPMLTEKEGPARNVKGLTLSRQWMTRIVWELQSEGDSRVHFIEFPPQSPLFDGVGCDWHPSLKTHRKMASQLAAAIAGVLHWH